MHHVLATPMFDARPTVFGMDPGVVVLVVALLGAVIGLLWIRRVVHVEGDPQTFRSSSRRGPSTILMFAVAAAAVAGALVYLALTLA